MPKAPFIIAQWARARTRYICTWRPATLICGLWSTFARIRRMTTCFAVLPGRYLLWIWRAASHLLHQGWRDCSSWIFSLYKSYVHALTNNERKFMYLSKSTIQNYDYARETCTCHRKWDAAGASLVQFIQAPDLRRRTMNARRRITLD